MFSIDVSTNFNIETYFIRDKLIHLSKKYVRKIGKGGEGKVYLYKIKKNGDKIAVKNSEYIVHEIFIGNILNGLDIENFCKIYGYEEKGGDIYSVQEYIKGKTLNRCLKHMDEIDFFMMLIQIVSALETAYKECGFIHCDLHTNNIIRNDDGIYKIIDYGFSCINIDRNIRFGINNKYMKIDIDNVYPMYDIFKLLGFCYSTCKYYNNINLISLLEYIFKEYFGIDIQSCYKKCYKEYFSYEKKDKRSYGDFYNFLENIYE